MSALPAPTVSVDPNASLIMIEFNELAPRLIERFMGDGTLPNFKRFYESSTVYTTDAGEDPPNLEPWIAWPAIHYGVEYARHGAFHLGDGRKIPFKGIAELLSEAGVRVGVFGSMNTNYETLNGYYVPDPWDTRAQPSPASLKPYFDFVSSQVQEHTKNDEGAGGGKLAFVKFLVTHGLSLATALKIAAQLASERKSPDMRWRRAVMLDYLSYDVFRSLNRSFDVRFATYFSNSVAHFQHYFWRNMDPESFVHPPDSRDPASLRDAVREGYRTMDHLLARFMTDYPDSTLVFCTALSQQPWTDTVKCVYRPRNFEAFLRFAGIDDTVTVKPVMAEEFQLDCPDAETVQRTIERLAALQFDGGSFMGFNAVGLTIFTGCAVNVPADDAMFARSITRAGGGAVPFGEYFYQVTTMRSGRHHRDGCLWIRNGKHRVVDGRLPLTAVAPMILGHFGVDRPDYMAEKVLVEA